MKNVEMKVEDNILTIKVDLTKEFGPSASVRIPTQVATRFRFIPPPDSDLSRHLIPI